VTQKRVVVDSSGWIEVFTDGEHAEWSGLRDRNWNDHGPIKTIHAAIT
jgi:hypothetical protein